MTWLLGSTLSHSGEMIRPIVMSAVGGSLGSRSMATVQTSASLPDNDALSGEGIHMFAVGFHTVPPDTVDGGRPIL